MNIGNIAHLIRKEENEQTRAAARNSIFSEVKRRITNSDLKTREAVVKFLKDKGVDCDNNNLSDDDAIKVSGLMELIDSMQKIKEEAKKKANMPAKRSSNQQSKKNKPEANPALTNKELKKIEEEAKKKAENLRKKGVISKEAKGSEKLEIERLKNQKLKSLKPLKNIPNGYKLVDAGGNGNCFYRSIAHIVRGNKNNYLSIRNSAAKIASNLEEKVKGLKETYGIDYNHKLGDLDEGMLNYAFGNIPFMNIIRQGFGYAKNGNIETIGDALHVLKKIRESLSTDRKEGGEAELYFISVAIGKPVVIYDNNGNVTGYSPTLSPILGRFLGQEDISMLGNDKVMVYREGVGDNGHFQALVKK